MEATQVYKKMTGGSHDLRGVESCLERSRKYIDSDSFEKGRTMPRWPVYDDEEAGIGTANLHADS